MSNGNFKKMICFVCSKWTIQRVDRKKKTFEIYQISPQTHLTDDMIQLLHTETKKENI